MWVAASYAALLVINDLCWLLYAFHRTITSYAVNMGGYPQFWPGYPQKDVNI